MSACATSWEKWVSGVCGLVTVLLKKRPAIGPALLPVVVDSLELDDDTFEDSADCAACHLIGAIFLAIRNPALTAVVVKAFLDPKPRPSKKA